MVVMMMMMTMMGDIRKTDRHIYTESMTDRQAQTKRHIAELRDRRYLIADANLKNKTNKQTKNR